ncbi:MAG: hypothetical protein KJ645_13610, partial [Planctomycetes bacterium]|nr:hypothetical protein [Planctomycetota bacterium]
QLFNIKEDPQELINLYEDKAEMAEQMMMELNQYIIQLPEPGPIDPSRHIDKETIQTLKNLGY